MDRYSKLQQDYQHNCSTFSSLEAELAASQEELTKCRVLFNKERAFEQECSDKLSREVARLMKEVRKTRAECNSQVTRMMKESNEVKRKCEQHVLNLKEDSDRQVTVLEDECDKLRRDCLQLKTFVDKYAREHHHLLPSLHNPFSSRTKVKQGKKK